MSLAHRKSSKYGAKLMVSIEQARIGMQALKQRTLMVMNHVLSDSHPKRAMDE